MDTSIVTSIDTPINHKSKIKKGESEGESEGEYGLTWLREFIARRDDAEALKIGGTAILEILSFPTATGQHSVLLLMERGWQATEQYQKNPW